MKTRYRFRFYPSESQRDNLARTFGCARFVYNWGLRLRSDAFRNGEKIGYHESSARLTALKKQEEFSWLNEVSCVPTQQALRHLQSAYDKFFKKQGKYPSFKSKHGKQSAEYTTSAFKWDVQNKNLHIAKLGRLRVRWSREFESSPSTVTITKDCAGRYFVTLCLDEQFPTIPKSGEDIGIDFGVARLATFSNGEHIPNMRYTRLNEKKLAKAQKILSRRKKGSGRWNRQRLKVARVHSHIADSRKDHLDKVTTNIVRRFDNIFVEDLNIRGMIHNHCLSKSISDASIGTAIKMLEYKVERYGKAVTKIDRWFPSSKTCSSCGFRVSKMDLSIRYWNCPECNTKHDRDENAAKNILAVGHTVSARGGDVRLVKGKPLKSKPHRNVNRQIVSCVQHN